MGRLFLERKDFSPFSPLKKKITLQEQRDEGVVVFMSYITDVKT
jgi:hypothetical protein